MSAPRAKDVEALIRACAQFNKALARFIAQLKRRK